MKTDDELKKIAIDIVEGRIFTDRQIQNVDDINRVFMPIALGAFKDTPAQDLENISMIYEYLDKAGPRSINGMPIFFSLNVLTTDEYVRMYKFYKEYSELKEKFMTKEEPSQDQKE